ncbi:winged helix DNA-binding domain-containing protein [Actinomycetospora endophytica]|uniref:Winged helix DNA-binding domain-containing protein n=1 Tax=Actinomycetospora endophytica TaxID=2291215 RepID=A0ABS8PDQ3_9PSEU|nr:winged helix DNA-binding domain-containing protein [Actinomycetospora endophytica]MCD2196396.1 winged helix DNA-binding domain-containing protein [Actinomycetospora endophytica]
MNTDSVGLRRLAALRLVGPRCATPADAVAVLGAAQGQDLPGVLESIALRTASGDAGEVRQAFDDGLVVRSWPMRRTLHVVPARDLAWMLPLATARPLAEAAKRRTQFGLADEAVDRAGEVAREALAGGGRLTRGELAQRWADAGLALESSHVTHTISVLAMHGVLAYGPFAGAKEQALVLLDEWVPEPRRLDRDEALAEWARIYFTGHGPARRQDFARWTGLPAADVRTALDGAREHLVTDDDGMFLDPTTPDRLADAADPGAELLLPGFDEFVLGYGERAEVLDPAHADRIVPGGNGVFRPTIVRDGRVVGCWKWAGSGRNRRVERDLFAG